MFMLLLPKSKSGSIGLGESVGEDKVQGSKGANSAD